ncbi:MAG: histidine kinase [Saprospiraceae bacterium]|nr:histidine kinase [Saprospiraceae bacterium]
MFTLSGNIGAQSAWTHTSDITALTSDSLGELYFQDIHGKFYKFHEQKQFIRLNKISPELEINFNRGLLNQSYNLKDGSVVLTESCVVKDTDSDQQLFCKPFSFSCAAIFNDGLLLGTREHGLWVYDQEAIRKFYINGVYFPEDIEDIQVSKGNVWILSGGGSLYLYDMHLQTLRSIEADIDAFFIDLWNVVWTTSDAQVKKDTRFIHDAPPILHLESDYVLSLDEDHSYIYFNTYYSPNPAQVRVEYAVGVDKWKETEHNNMIILEDLAYGTLPIHLRARTPNSTSKEHKIMYSLASPWWQSYWPYLFGGVILLLGIAVLAQRMQLKTRRRLQAETKVIREELRVLKLQQKMGQLQMNPHFIFNALNSISGLIAVGHQKDARKYLNSFAQMMRSLLEASTKEWISVADEVKFLKHYLGLEQMAHGQKFDFEIIEELKSNLWIPPMLIQPFVENAILHGIKHKKGHGKIEVEFVERNKILQVTILDDGIGRKAAGQFRKEGHTSHAISIINDRIAALSRSQKSKFIEMEDIVSVNGEALGTKVIILIPFKAK